MMKNTGLTEPFYKKLAFVLISILAMGFLIVNGKEILTPVVFSCLFSIMLLPICRFLEKKLRFPKSLAAMSSVILLLSMIAAVFYFLGAQLSALGDDWPMFKQQFSSSITDLQGWISEKFHVNNAKQMHYVQDASKKIMDSGTTLVGTTLLSATSMIIFLVFTFIYTFFFLIYRGLILKFFVQVFQEKNEPMVYEIMEQVQFIIRKYITGLVIEMTVIIIFVSTVFSIMGIKYAILLGLITGLFNIIPYIGIFSAILISSLITFATTALITKVVAVIGVLVFTHLVDSNVLLPVIVGSKVRINAMVTLLGVVIGEMIWGIPGMFVSIPVVAVLKIIFDRVEDLKPWGLILGDPEKKSKKTIDKINGDNKPSLEEKLE